ncbi:penicillin-binding protein activator LpoB [Zobellella endophytica]|uniref:Penicillin-binding protein activator LpoB n=1 Tax=Zobellella endophytica TaxID=2116700 RepID=A0A2P7R5W9_9GAMM|nr:penicillin-binding protein activator LpoB [Zobellella endophytica]PSJ45608.1 penicillin-binding protein activator LpoB [Zobellella endophytica]
MTLSRFALVVLAGGLLSACGLPNPYSSQPAPVTPATPGPVQPAEPAPQPPVIQLPEAPVTPLPEARSANLERLADNLAARLKASSAIAEVSGPVLLDDIRNQAGSPVDTRGLTERLQANLSGPLTFVGGAQVSSLRQQLAYQGGRADVASLVRLGKQSGADYLLSGNLSRAGGGFRLQAQLMDLSSGEVLWSDSVNGQ